MGLENISLPEAICLVSFVVIPMAYASIAAPAELGYTFITFASLSYIIAAFVSARRQGGYNEP